jgi:hypothetical protein
MVNFMFPLLYCKAKTISHSIWGWTFWRRENLLTLSQLKSWTVQPVAQSLYSQSYTDSLNSAVVFASVESRLRVAADCSVCL